MQFNLWTLVCILSLYISLGFAQEEVEFDLHIFIDIYNHNDLTSGSHKIFTQYIKEASGELSYCPYNINYLNISDPTFKYIFSKKNNLFYNEEEHLFSYCVFRTKQNSDFNTSNHYDNIRLKNLDYIDVTTNRESAMTILWSANNLRGYSLKMDAPPCKCML